MAIALRPEIHDVTSPYVLLSVRLRFAIWVGKYATVSVVKCIAQRAIFFHPLQARFHFSDDSLQSTLNWIWCTTIVNESSLSNTDEYVLTKNSLYLKPRLHDITGYQNGLTTGWMFVHTMQPVVHPVVQPVWQPVVSCKRGLARIMTIISKNRPASFAKNVWFWCLSPPQPVLSQS